MSAVLLAVDPGANGGVAWTDGAELHAVKMPETNGDLLHLLREVAPCAIYVERVGGHVAGGREPGSAMFKFGFGVGVLHGLALALGIPLHQVRPAEWQARLGIGRRGTDETKSAWKNRIKAEVERRHPTVRVTLATADAIGILDHAVEVQK